MIESPLLWVPVAMASVSATDCAAPFHSPHCPEMTTSHSGSLGKVYVLPEWVGSTRLAVIAAAHARNVLCRPDTCRSLMRERWFIAWPARGTTGQKATFPVLRGRS